jgi:NAD(P)-dependent dehydrogenase (short-subunit alcohol dehydrogenase family)
VRDAYRDKVVLITGGTKGIGLATAKVFARHGAKTVLTYRWGTADEDALRATFRGLEAPEPLIVQADVGRAEDTAVLFERVQAEVGPVHAFIANASNALLTQSLDDYSERGLGKSIRASAWYVFEYLQEMKRRFGRYPKYVVAMSSDGPDRYTPAYDFVAASKAVLETLVRYTAYRLRDEAVCINVLRSRAIKTDSFTDTFGGDFYGFLQSIVDESWFMEPDEVARAAFALTSGMFDAVTGQTITVDCGNIFSDGVSYLYERRVHLGL